MTLEEAMAEIQRLEAENEELKAKRLEEYQRGYKDGYDAGWWSDRS